jgi:hypothetical protein
MGAFKATMPAAQLDLMRWKLAVHVKWVMAKMREHETDGDEIIQVPVPKRLLPAVYRVLADAMAPLAASTEPRSQTPPVSHVVNRNLIDLIAESARHIGADRRPVSLTDLYNAYRQTYPGVVKGATRGSFDATVNYHCINMRSRFPDVSDKRKSANWLSRPIFKRVSRAQYMLLSDDEIMRFHHAVAKDASIVYTDEYDVDKLPT